MITSFVPQDRRAALAAGRSLPAHARGAVAFADIVGFTNLTGRLVESLGEQRGAEELTRVLGGAFTRLVHAVEVEGGSVVSFAGDAILCWFPDDDGLRATRAALAMRDAMAAAPESPAPDGGSSRLQVKTTVTVGEVTRLLLGDRAVQVVEALAGVPLSRLSALQHVVRPGEVVLDADAARLLADGLELGPEREAESGVEGVPVLRVHAPRTERAAPVIPPEMPMAEVQPWVPPVVYQRLVSDQGSLIPSIRPAVALFVSVDGLEPDRDDAAATRLSDYVAHLQSVLTRNGGVLLDVTTGDKGTYFLGAFGVPTAHGDDLLRAVWTADDLRRPPAGSGITGVRIGLSAGSVYAGLYGAPGRSTYGIQGVSVNTAARLMQLAAPGKVLLHGGFGAATARRFEIRPLPPQFLKGYPAPVAVSELVGARPERAVRLPEPQYTVPMVGRRHELRRGLAAIRQAGGGQGQALGLCGEPGMGKSRLLYEVVQLALAAGFEAFVGAAEPFRTGVPYQAWRPIWRQFFGLSAGVAPEEQQALLEARLGGLDHALPALAPLLGPLLGIQIPDTEVTGPIPVPARKAMVADILVRCLSDRATGRPVLIALEDGHNLDSVSLELLADIHARVADLPLLLAVTYRSPAVGEPHLLGADFAGGRNEIALSAFSEDDAAELIDLKLGELWGLAGEAPEPLVRRLLDRAQGNPFFLEELLNHLRDVGADPLDEAALTRLELPSSLQSLILDRVDRLSPEQQRVVGSASVVGRRFEVDWLCGAFAGLGSREAVVAALDALERLDLVALDGTGVTTAYLFKHAATRDVAYQSLAFEAREDLHESLADFLEREFAAAPPVQLLAQHYGQSRNRAKELAYSLPAGELAVAQGAYREAAQYLGRGLEIVNGLEPSTSRSETELALQLGLGGVLLTTQGQGSSAAKQCFDRAFELTSELPPGPQLVRALFGLWTFYLFRGDMGPTSDLATEILGAAERFADPEALLQAHFAMSATVYWLGDFEGTARHADEVNRLYRPDQASMYVARYAQNPKVTAAADAAWAEWIMGRPDAARRRSEETVAHARELGHDFVLTIALQIPAFVAVHAGDVAATVAATAAWLEVAGRVGNPVYLGLATACMGWARAAMGDVDEGLGMLAAVRQGFLAQGVEVVEPLFVTMLGDALLRAGRAHDGLDLLAGAMDRAMAKGQDAYRAEQHRLRGELRLLATRDADPASRSAARLQAEADMRTAAEIARGQGARAYELRALMSLARLLDADGAAAVMRELADVRGAITEGADTPDLRAADELLAAHPVVREEAVH